MDVVLRIYRGDGQQGAFQDYAAPLHEGMVVVDAIHHIQATWNCKAGRGEDLRPQRSRASHNDRVPWAVRRDRS